MPKIGMEPIRRAALVNATIFEVGLAGSLDVTVGKIASRAGVSSALAHHYFGGKDALFLAAMRHILSEFGAQVLMALAKSETDTARVEAVIRASFGSGNFRPGVIAAWLGFYVEAQRNPEAARLLRIYQKRLRSNLLFGLRRLHPKDAEQIAETISALIDGLYIRQALQAKRPEPNQAIELVLTYLRGALST
ncbi:MAG: TetR/AcrR family bet gene transcriptional repressor [Paracoccaceae bacterium]|jgi:TetR/AcrR family transcriptional repressor of bet genes